MRILEVSKLYPPFWGGIETVVYDISTVLKQEGYDVDVLCVSEKNQSSEEVIDKIEARLANLPLVSSLLDQGKTPEDMLDIVLEGLQPRILDKIDVKFECECCKDKVQEALVAIGKTALSQIIEEDKQAEVGCQFCNSKYMYNEEELLNILKDM